MQGKLLHNENAWIAPSGKLLLFCLIWAKKALTHEHAHPDTLTHIYTHTHTYTHTHIYPHKLAVSGAQGVSSVIYNFCQNANALLAVIYLIRCVCMGVPLCVWESSWLSLYVCRVCAYVCVCTMMHPEFWALPNGNNFMTKISAKRFAQFALAQSQRGSRRHPVSPPPPGQLGVAVQ